MSYATGFARLSEAELYRSISTYWEKHTPEARLALYQEVENRQAEKQGRPARKIELYEDDHDQWSRRGYFSESDPDRDCLFLNKRFVEGKLPYLGIRKNKDELMSGVEGLRAVLHLGRHYYQYLVVNYDGYAPDMDERMRKAWKMSWTECGGHVYNLGDINSWFDNKLFHIRGNLECECDARRYTEDEMVRIAAMLREETGNVDLEFERIIHEMRKFENVLNNLSDKEDTLELMDSFDFVARNFHFYDGNDNPYQDNDMSGISMFATYREELKKRLAARKDGSEIVDQPDSVDALLDRMKEAAVKEKVDRAQSVKIDAKRGI